MCKPVWAETKNQMQMIWLLNGLLKRDILFFYMNLKQLIRSLTFYWWYPQGQLGAIKIEII